MSGSYWHVTTDQHQLLDDPKHQALTYHEQDGIEVDWASEAYEAIAHMYSMIWYLADKAAEGDKARALALVEEARRNEKAGFAASPGVAPPPDDEE
uniref:hypothetical protein n=1 Tax=Amycolatopsis sp. CA-096443 TaxID=3239919 RepID=UPI003F4991F4